METLTHVPDCPQATTLPPEPQLAPYLPGEEDNVKEEVDEEFSILASSELIHTDSLLGAEGTEEDTFLLPDVLSSSRSALKRPRLRPQQKSQLTEEVLERLRDIVNKGDPMTRYTEFVQVGR
ncbi:hypothetical protein IHE44_0003069, partial [Lamprotornis superbus]